MIEKIKSLKDISIPTNLKKKSFFSTKILQFYYFKWNIIKIKVDIIKYYLLPNSTGFKLSNQKYEYIEIYPLSIFM